MAEGMKLNWGLYPPEYNKALHGTYDPARYYGKREFSESEWLKNERKNVALRIRFLL